MKATVDDAHLLGLQGRGARAWDEGIRWRPAAGVDSIEHAS